jgi:hypothetical protein
VGELAFLDLAYERATVAIERANELVARAQTTGVAELVTEALWHQDRVRRTAGDYVRAVERVRIDGECVAEEALNVLEAIERTARPLAFRVLVERMKASATRDASTQSEIDDLLGLDIRRMLRTSRSKVARVAAGDEAHFYAAQLEELCRGTDRYAAGKPWRAMVEGSRSPGVIYGREILRNFIRYGSANMCGAADRDRLETDNRAATRLQAGKSWERQTRVELPADTSREAPTTPSRQDGTAAVLLRSLEGKIAKDDRERVYLRLRAEGFNGAGAREESGLSRSAEVALIARAGRRHSTA